MRRPICVVSLCAVVLAIDACGDDEDEFATTMATTPTGSPDSDTADGATGPEPTAGAPDGSTGGGPTSGGPGGSGTAGSGELEWEFTITGDVEAEASGVVLVLHVGAGGATPGGTVTFNSASASANGGLEGQYKYFEDDEANGEHLAPVFQLRIPGGMNCGNDAGAGVFMTIDVTDATMESYDATFSGPVVCDNGTAATAEGFLRQR